MEYDNDSPATSESQTPTFPVCSGMVGVPAGMAGVMPQMAPMMPGYYNMYPWAQMSGMMPQMPVMSTGMTGVSGMMPQMMPHMMPQMMAPMMPGNPAAADNVYRPTLDFLTGASQTCTPLHSQFTADETFSMEELGLSPIRVPPTDIPTAGGRPTAGARRGPSKKKGKGRGKGKGVAGESSQPVAGDNEEEEEEARIVWTDEQCVALSKAWISVCDDPLVSNNQRIHAMWSRIAAAYKVFHPDGKTYSSEECRKQWERIRAAVSRFAGIYKNNEREMTSGQTMEDVKTLSMHQFPEKGKFAKFKYWDAYLVLMDSAKFRAGVAADWPKRQKVTIAGDYSSSAGSHDLPDSAEEAPTPPSFSRRRRPVGQKTAHRMSRAAGGGSHEVQSAAFGVQPSPELSHLARMQQQQSMIDVIEKWNASTNPLYKEMLRGVIESMRRDLGLPPLGTGGPSGDSDAAGSGQGGDEE